MVPSFADLEAAEAAAAAGKVGYWVRVVNGVLSRDGHLQACLEQRIASVAKEWHVVPGGPDEADEVAAEMVRAAIASVGEDAFRAHLTNQATADAYGFSATEIDWVKADGMWQWANLAPVWHELFEVCTPVNRYDGATLDELLLSLDNTIVPERLRPGQWVVTTRRVPRPLWQTGLLVPGAWYSLMKIQAMANLNRADASAGAPFPVIMSPDDEPSEEEKQAWAEIVANFGQDGGAMLWNNARLEAVTVTDRMASAPREALAARCDLENAKLFLGGSLVSDSNGKAAYALGTLHEARFYERVLRTALTISADNERQLFRPFLDANGVGGRTPQLRLRILPEQDPKTYVALAAELHKLGILVSAQQLLEMTALRPETDPERLRRDVDNAAAQPAAQESP